jgi:hypothetical protein
VSISASPSIGSKSTQTMKLISNIPGSIKSWDHFYFCQICFIFIAHIIH